MSGMMQQMAGLGIRERMRRMQQLTSTMMSGNGVLPRQKKGTGKRLTSKERAQLKKERERELRRMKREQKEARRSNPRG
jgi:signal recognition particle subunit SRP54